MRSTLVVFVVLAYGISWIVWAPVILLFCNATAPPSWALLLAFVGAYGPSIAAIITSLTYGETDGLVSLFRTAAGRASWRWYLLVILGPPAFVWCAAGMQALAGGQIRLAGAQALAKMMVVLATFIPFGPLAEELGWRGYALPRLEKAFPPLLSSMILGIIWAAWHVPMFWFSPIGMPRRNPGAIGMWAANLMGFSVLLSYAARRTGFSVPIAILLHATLNAGPVMGIALITGPPADLHAVENKAQMVRWVVVLIAAVALAREGARAGRKLERCEREER